MRAVDSLPSILPAHDQPLRRRVAGLGGAMLAMPGLWWLRRCERADLRRLLSLAPYLVVDLGLSIAEAEEEARKPFWRA